jgi:mannose/fructose/N-acetylgalactosamine-specific phosphotransferase system component IIC
MRAVMVIYLTLTMFFTIVESEGYHGARFTKVSAEDIPSSLENASFSISTNSSFDSLINPLATPLGLIKTFLKIVYKSLTFQFEIQGAPDVVNFMVKTLFAILAWLALWDLIQVFGAIISGIASLIRSLLPF